MGRKPRLEYPGALYHVLNGGPGEEPLFRGPGEARAFVDCLAEACHRLGWRLHAYCLLPRSYHLAVETPRPNLVQGMHWLQSTYGNRFTAERRRLFRSRYRAIVVEPGQSWDEVVDYIHFSPAREGLVGPAQLALYRWSSLRGVAGGGDGPGIAGVSLVRRGEGYLARLAAGGGRSGRMGRGWIYGGEGFRRERLEQLRRAEGAGREAADRQEWQAWLEKGAKALERDLGRVSAESKAAPWKIALASWLRGRTSASNRWLGDSLAMGPPDAVSRYIGELKRGLRAEAGREAEILEMKTAGL